MIEENGHRWFEGSTDDRCMRCQMKYGYYLDIKKALKEQPERNDLRELIKCGTNMSIVKIRFFYYDGGFERRMNLIYSPDENEYYWEAYNITTHKTDISQSFKTEKEAEFSRLQKN